jgi:uncharacterized protein YjgD (DUF1641 family)
MKTKTHRQKLKEKVIENKFQFYKLIKKINWKNKNQIWMKKILKGYCKILRGHAWKLRIREKIKEKAKW